MGEGFSILHFRDKRSESEKLSEKPQASRGYYSHSVKKCDVKINPSNWQRSITYTKKHKSTQEKLNHKDINLS